MEESRIKFLITRYLANEATEEEQEQLLYWVAQSDEHQRLFSQYIKVWDTRQKAVEPFDLPIALQKLNYRIDQLEREERAAQPSFNFRRLAAVVTLMLVAFTTLYVVTQTIDTPRITKRAQPGERLAFMLPDGSRIKLNSNAVLSFSEEFDNEIREVYLTGEAFFDVTKDSKRPFIIHTGDVKTEVLGTSFNVYSDSTLVEVSVASGKVRVSDKNNELLLTSNQKAIHTASTGDLKKTITSLEQELAWKDNTLLFDDATLEEAATTLSKWFNVTIHFENDKLKQCTISGKYKNQSLNAVLKSISFSTGIEYTINNNLVELSGKGCETTNH